MTEHPTVRDGDLEVLRDDMASDWIERRELALVAFLDSREISEMETIRERLRLTVAKLALGDRLAGGIIDLAHDVLVADALHIKTAPFLVLFAHGEVVDRLMGAPPVPVLVDVVKTRLKTLG